PRDPFGRIKHRGCVRHAANGSKASSCGGGSSRGNCFFVTLAGLAQVYVQVNESGCDDQASGIEGFIRAATNLVDGSNLSNLTVAQEHIHERVNFGNRIDDAAAANEKTS